MSEQLIEFNNWQGGLDLSDSDISIGPAYLLENQDTIWNQKGVIKKRNGYGVRPVVDSINCKKVVCADRTMWSEQSQAIVMITVEEDEEDELHTVLSLMPPDEAPIEIYRMAGTSRFGDTDSGWNKPESERASTRLDTTMMTCDAFTIALQYDESGFDADDQTRSNQIRKKLRPTDDVYNIQITYIRGRDEWWGGEGSGWSRTFAGEYVDEGDSVAAPIFDWSKPKFRNGFKYVTTNALYTIFANQKYQPQHFYWSGNRELLSGGQDSHTYSIDDFSRNTAGDNSHIQGLRSNDNNTFFFKEKSISVLKISPNPKGFRLEGRVHQIGCIDHRSIADSPEGYVFASFDGIYRFDGITPVNITDEQIAEEWRLRVADWKRYERTCVGVIVGDYYIVGVINNNGTLIGGDSLICHLPSSTWGTTTNMPLWYTCPSEDSKNIYGFRFRDSDTVNIAILDDMFKRVNDSVDPYGVGPTFSIQLANYIGPSKLRIKNIRQIQLSYSAIANSGNPTLDLKYITDLGTSNKRDINWNSDSRVKTLSSLPNHGTSIHTPPSNVRRTLSTHDVGFRLRIRENTTSGILKKCEINTVSYVGRISRPNRIKF